MKVKCVLCDKIEDLNDDTSLAKRLRNRPIHTYMCLQCNERIEKKTIARHETGNFKLFKQKQENDEW